MATVNLKGVSKHYGVQPILENITLSIEKGEFVALVGPSGSGKTTLLRMVAGLESINTGEILINGKCVNDVSPANRDMAMVFQNYALYPHMTVAANMAYGLKIRGLKKSIIQKKVAEVSAMLHLEELLLRKPAQLSGGQKQRVAMGRAIVRSPSVFLFDEPLSNLDLKLRNEMRYEIKKLHQQLNITSLYVTHDQTEAMTLADKIVLLNKGKIEQIGTPQALYNYPASLFVASFIGAYPINFIQAHFDRRNQQITTDSGIVIPFAPRSFEGNEITMGIRPEHMLLTNKDNAMFAGKIHFIEDMGADKLIQIKLANHQIILVRVIDFEPTDTDAVYIRFDLNKAHLFCPKTGIRLGEGNEEK